MINLASCPLCLNPNFLEAAALSLHIDLMHDTHLAVPTPQQTDQAPDRDE